MVCVVPTLTYRKSYSKSRNPKRKPAKSCAASYRPHQALLFLKITYEFCADTIYGRIGYLILLV